MAHESENDDVRSRVSGRVGSESWGSVTFPLLGAPPVTPRDGGGWGPGIWMVEAGRHHSYSQKSHKYFQQRFFTKGG
jgi:hypothetical protein